MWRFTVVVLLALALRAVFFIGYANVDPWDDTLYLELARAVRGETTPRAPRVFPAAAFAARRGAYYPVALAQVLLGENELASSLYSLLASLGLVALAYRLGHRLGGEEAALWSAGLVAVFPLDLAYATRITADTPVAFWMSASVWLALEARWARRPRLRDPIFGASALALLVAAWTRISGLVVLPVVGGIVVCAAARRETTRGPLVFALVLASGLLLDGAWQRQQRGSFWAVPEAEIALQRSVVRSLPEVRLYPLPGLVLHLSYTEGSLHELVKEATGAVEIYPSISPFSLFAPLGAVALLAGALFRGTRWLSAWGLLVLVFFQYGFRALHLEPDGLHYYLLAARPRYLLALAVPVMVLLGMGLARIGARSRTASVAIGVVILAAALQAAWRNHAFYRGSMGDVRLAASFLDGVAAPVYTDDWARSQLPLYLHAPYDLRAPVSSPPEGAVLLVGGSRGFDVAGTSVARGLPEPLRSVHLGAREPPEGVEEIFRVRGERNEARLSDLVVLRVSSER